MSNIFDVTRGYTNAKAIIKINGQDINVVFDSGCSGASMPIHIMNQLGLVITDPRCSASTMSNGNQKTSYGMLEAEIEIANRTIKIPFKVIETVKNHLLLGTYFFITTQAKINYKKMIVEMRYNQEKFSIPFSINNIETNVCIDSGCDGMSFMTMKKAKKLGLKIKPTDENDYCMGVGGQSKIEGVCSTTIEFDSFKFPINFEIGNSC
ncbi:11622_t:CDS:2, partial [Cetraspora pellucida]